MDLKIASINVRGLGDKTKRREMFNWLRSKNMSVYFIQEAHCTKENINDWRAEWGYQALFSCCSTKKAGVAILFNNNFCFQITATHVDPEGRFLICDLSTSGKCFTLVNIYAPNNDNPNFFINVSEQLKKFNCDEIIFGGDFNLVLDIAKDKKGGLARTHQKARDVVCELCEHLDLTDVWRAMNPDQNRYTWRQKKPEVQCRLDFFLISQSTLCNTFCAGIIPGYKTDHSMITLQISVHSNARGKGFWKLNTSFLSEIEYINCIKLAIQRTKDEYAGDISVSPSLLWEMVKLKVREESLKYGARKKKENYKERRGD